MVAPVVGRPLTQLLVSETKRNWPFVVGFAGTFTLVAKPSTVSTLSLSFFSLLA